jgi:hypothetical protein
MVNTLVLDKVYRCPLLNGSCQWLPHSLQVLTLKVRAQIKSRIKQITQIQHQI